MSKKIRYVIIDVDGTLTDGIVYIGNAGEVCKGFYVRDGLGILMLKDYGITPMILTSRESRIVLERCRELGIKEIQQGVKDKCAFMKQWMELNRVKSEELAYIADDINDLEAMKLAAYRGCPKDAVSQIKEIANFQSAYCGGNGAVREFCEYLVKA